ncbi:MAG: Maf family protein [Candidatus Cloacimonetes bacterium]|nr:Maf family protein [Candidatus Cloacimonadota bacterium]
MIHNILKDRRVILASKSPRRQQIFGQLGLKVLYMPAEIDENIKTTNPRKYVISLAKQKATHVAKAMDPECVVVAADTVVYLNGEILNKPEDDFQAAHFLSLLSGQPHFVYTGLCVCYHGRSYTDYARTAVTFKELTATEISDYIETGEPTDKAGAYGIQGYGSQFITRVVGCYFNVMGFPVANFYELLKNKVFRNEG